jgi:hypothetical protein
MPVRHEDYFAQLSNSPDRQGASRLQIVYNSFNLHYALIPDFTGVDEERLVKEGGRGDWRRLR